ncbi:MAG: hemin uptake protein HemP [Gammaproteobacteria bacterium]|nr:hemin uptake protein HemP [Gammaproteobacteria bacterium]
MRDTERTLSSSRAAGPKPVEPRSIESGELLGASSQVFILHAGHVYTLRRIKENKLILTK